MESTNNRVAKLDKPIKLRSCGNFKIGNLFSFNPFEANFQHKEKPRSWFALKTGSIFQCKSTTWVETNLTFWI